MKIGELARRGNVHPETVRRLHRRGLITAVRDINNHRVFDEQALAILARMYRRGEPTGRPAPTDEALTPR